jgi:hypothetical protein
VTISKPGPGMREAVLPGQWWRSADTALRLRDRVQFVVIACQFGLVRPAPPSQPERGTQGPSLGAARVGSVDATGGAGKNPEEE